MTSESANAISLLTALKEMKMGNTLFCFMQLMMSIGQNFSATVAHCKLIHKGPPNQYFINKITRVEEALEVTPPTEEKLSVNFAAGNFETSGAIWEEIFEQHLEPVDDNAAEGEEFDTDKDNDNQNNANSPSSCGDWEWSEILNEIPCNTMGPVLKNNPALNHVNPSNFKT